jgi:23S rRNA (uracil747-C5)-methyltransferase
VKCHYYSEALCRSCTELPRPYAEQLAHKQAQAQARLSAVAAESWLPPVPSAEAGFRNKAKMAIGGSVTAPTLGLLEPGGHGVDLMQCPLYPESMQRAFVPIREALIAAQVPPYELAMRRGEGKYVLLTEAPGTAELMLRFVLRSREAVARLGKQVPVLLAALPALRVVSANLLPEHKAVTEGEIEILLTDTTQVRCRINEFDFQLTPRSFLQTNTEVAAALYRQARDWIAQAAPARVWDLYCGVGGFARHAAAPSRVVTGVETTPEAIAAAEASEDQIRWICADATDWACAQSTAPDCVIVNPPRRGIGARLANWIDQSGAATVLYSSCNIDSLARDLGSLRHYRISAARVFDMFPHTTHFETLVKLERASGA